MYSIKEKGFYQKHIPQSAKDDELSVKFCLANKISTSITKQMANVTSSLVLLIVQNLLMDGEKRG